MKASVSVHLKDLRIRRENYINCRRHHVRFAVFVGFWKDYRHITFAQAKQNQIFTRQNLLQTLLLRISLNMELTGKYLRWL